MQALLAHVDNNKQKLLESIEERDAEQKPSAPDPAAAKLADPPAAIVKPHSPALPTTNAGHEEPIRSEKHDGFSHESPLKP